MVCTFKMLSFQSPRKRFGVLNRYVNKASLGKVFIAVNVGELDYFICG